MNLLERVQRAREGVGRSLEVRRVSALPYRDPNYTPEDLTPLFSVDGLCKGCELCYHDPPKLRPLQTKALWEAEAARGLFAPMGVGTGKELTCLLLSEVFQAERPVVLTRSRLKDQLLRIDVPRYSKHFRFSPPTVVSYSELSTAGEADILDRLKPDLIIANEAHCLRGKDAARTKRFLRYMAEHPETIFCALSGTMANRSLLDYAHLIHLALRRGSPLPPPSSYYELQDWSRALDADCDDPLEPGALLDLCPGFEVEQTRQGAREAYQRRLLGTVGVVSGNGNDDVGASLVLSQKRITVPKTVRDTLKQLRATWELDGEELMDAKDVFRVARQLACGFYYRWAWPNGRKDEEWLKARAAWGKDVRDFLKYRSRKGLDSPKLVENAAIAGSLYFASYEDWAHVKHRPLPPVEAVWLDRFLVDSAIEWAASCTAKAPGIVWYEHNAFGVELARRGLKVFGAGEDGDGIIDFLGNSCGASIAAHGEGKNLQHFSRNLVLIAPANGAIWEQLLGRTHRSGQIADVVEFEICLHDQSLRNALTQARSDARFVYETQGHTQKLLYSSCLITD